MQSAHLYSSFLFLLAIIFIKKKKQTKKQEQCKLIKLGLFSVFRFECFRFAFFAKKQQQINNYLFRFEQI